MSGKEIAQYHFCLRTTVGGITIRNRNLYFGRKIGSQCRGISTAQRLNHIIHRLCM